jgi:uncharacterized damage-inducible protein DinB
VPAAQRLSAGQFTAAHHTTYGSLRGILVHMLVAYQVWRSRCQVGRRPPAWLTDAEFPDLDTFIARFEQEQAALRAYIATLNNEDVQRSVSYTTSEGHSTPIPVAHPGAGGQPCHPAPQRVPLSC